jgi:tRNA G37 N-methylase TrmD
MRLAKHDMDDSAGSRLKDRVRHRVDLASFCDFVLLQVSLPAISMIRTVTRCKSSVINPMAGRVPIVEVY